MEDATPTRTEAKGSALRIGRILVPTDLSECAEQAYAYALALAAEHGAEVRLLHVFTLYEPELYGAVEDTPAAAELRERMDTLAQEKLEAFLHAHTRPGVAVEPALRRSMAAADTILKEAEAFGADLIVMGTHGRRGLQHLLLDSVAEEVVRRAHTSVLTVRGEAPRQMGHIGRILAPTDFSVPAGEAVRAARELAARYGAALDLLHVVEPVALPATVSMGTLHPNEYLPDLYAQIRAEMEALLEEKAEDPAPKAEVHVLEGHAAHDVVRFAEDHEVDLIVMATHGRSGLAHFLLGSVTERVVRTAPCPVLTVKTRMPGAE